MLLDTLKKHGIHLSIKNLAELTGIRVEDIIATLRDLKMLRAWKGHHVLHVSMKTVDQHLKNPQNKYDNSVVSSKLRWTPKVF